MMSDKELKELQDTENWDFERQDKSKRPRAPRAIVSVAFSREDFERVGTCAEHLGMRTSEFIRDAAIARAERQIGMGLVSSVSRNVTRAVFSGGVFSMTGVGATSEISGEMSSEERSDAVTA